MSVGAALIFSGENKTKLKPNDKLIIKNGKVHRIIRNGRSFIPAELLKEVNDNRDKKGEGSDGDSENGGSGIAPIRIIMPPNRPVCYRTFSNGQVIIVPCP